MIPAPDPDTKTRRQQRLDAVRAAVLERFQQTHPGLQKVSMTTDAILDLFDMGILDGSDDQFAGFLASLRQATPEPSRATRTD